jgi:uncharacterized protein DUF4157
MMETRLRVQQKAASPPSFTPVRGGLLQRKCACGGTPGPSGECEGCRKKRLTVSNAPQLVARPVPLADKQVREVELGHTDCDWDRAVKPDEPFKPRSGDAKVKVGEEKCTLPCTAEHEAVHLQQVGSLCKSYFTCYTGAPAKAKETKDCKEMTKPDERKKCEDLYTEYFRLECFVAVTEAWDAEAWECAAYKKSLACAEKELARGEKDCQGKLKEYKESAQKQIARYCKPEKEKKEEGKKPEGSKEPEAPKKPAEPEKPKEPEKKPKEPKEVLFRAGTLQRSSAAGARDEPNEVPPIVHEVLRSPGQPLDAQTRMFMEPRFGHDFRRVRVHTDEHAANSAQAVNALAYTVDNHIVFGTGRYAPETLTGRKLLAHELTHTIQQRGGLQPASPVLQTTGPESAPEKEADSVADSVVGERDTALPVDKHPVRLARQHLGGVEPARRDATAVAPVAIGSGESSRPTPATEDPDQGRTESSGLCIRTPLPPGQVRFQGCSEKQTARYRVLPENGDQPIQPAADTWYDADGVWSMNHSPATEWFKVPSHCDATLHCAANDFTTTSCCNAIASIFKGVPRWTSDAHEAMKNVPR